MQIIYREIHKFKMIKFNLIVKTEMNHKKIFIKMLLFIMNKSTKMVTNMLENFKMEKEMEKELYFTKTEIDLRVNLKMILSMVREFIYLKMEIN